MNKKLIEQIKNLPGVKMVEPCVGSGCVVTFEPEIEYIQCNSKEEYNFLFPIIHPGTFNPTIRVNFTKYPVWIKYKNCRTTKECVTTIKPECGFIDASDYINPNFTAAFQEYMVDEAIRRFPEGCTAWWAEDHVTNHNIERPFSHMGEHIQDDKGRWPWSDSDGWAVVIEEKPEEKKLEYYEKSLLEWRADGIYAFGEKYMVYSWLKKNRPEVYWREVLKVIAAELNEGQAMVSIHRIGFDRKTGFCEPIGVSNTTAAPGEVIFHSDFAAREAINIMGDKLRYLNGQPAPES